MKTGAIGVAVLAWSALSAFAAAHGQEAVPAPQYSAADFAKSMLAAPPPCTAATEAECEAAAKSRGFSLPTLSSKAVAGPATTAAGRSAPARPKIVGGANILVTFQPGSADITPQGRVNLKSVAEGMNRPSLAKHRFEVAGYTDPRGGETVNRPLSQSRAEAVMGVLVSEGVTPDRLSAHGYGSDPLVAPSDPTDERNRRVEIHRLD